MPAAGWRAVSTGFKYKDTLGANGPVRTAQVQKTNNGTFVIKAKASARYGAIDVVPPNPGTAACVRLDLA